MAKAIQLGRYHLLDRIAFGGMAEIYRAKTFDAYGRVHMVAVKLVLSNLAQDDNFIRMLVDEARIASLMKHESIARVYEFCHVGDEYFIAMEYVDGKDVRTILDRCRAERRAIPPELAAFITLHTLRGLHVAHNQTDFKGRSLNLIHRDVSPSNIICSYAGEVKLCDFGIAKATVSRVQTRSGVIKGKVKYMSPEQTYGRKLDPRSDIFAAGAVLYELLTRLPPFIAPNEKEMILLIRETKFIPVRERNPLVPPALEAIVDTAMALRPADRFQSALEFADALGTYLEQHAQGINRGHLGRFVRDLFAADIERELRALEEYVVVAAENPEVGVNLIADALGPEADYSKFSPMPTSASVNVGMSGADGLPELTPEQAAAVREQLHQAKTGMLDTTGEQPGGASAPGVHRARTAELTDPATAPLHHASTAELHAPVDETSASPVVGGTREDATDETKDAPPPARSEEEQRRETIRRRRRLRQVGRDTIRDPRPRHTHPGVGPQPQIPGRPPPPQPRPAARSSDGRNVGGSGSSLHDEPTQLFEVPEELRSEE